MRIIIGHDHTGVRTYDMAASKRFWCDTLGLVAIPEKENWLGFDDGRQFIHLMPAGSVPNPSEVSKYDRIDLANHVALQVSNLRDIVKLLLRHDLKPFQSEIDPSHRREITSEDQDLEFGIGTVFVYDPADNLVEFIDRHMEIFVKLKEKKAII